MEALLEKHEKLKLKYQKLYEMTKSYKDGYKKSQKKLNNLSVINQNLKKQIEHNNKKSSSEIKTLKTQIYKYKQIGSDFATKKKVLFLQQTVNTQEEKVFKLKEKLKDQNHKILNFNEITKNIKGENIDLKNTLNNIQLQISKHFPKTPEPSSSEESESDEIIEEQPGDIEVDTQESDVEVGDEVEDEESDIEVEDEESDIESESDSESDIENVEL